MLLCNEGRHCEEQRLFDCYKAVHTSGSNSQAFWRLFFHHVLFNRTACQKDFPMEADIFFPLYASSWRSSEYMSGLFTAINLSGEVQSEHSTEENTCMTSSEDNRVSIPPKGQKSVCQIPGAVIHPIGLESGCQMTGVVFHLNKWLFIHSVDFYRFFCWNRHRYIRPICTHCQILFKNTGSLCFLQHNHVKSWNLIIWSQYLCQEVFKDLRINRNLIEYPVLPWTMYSNCSLQ